MAWVRVNAQVGGFLEKAFELYVFFGFTVAILNFSLAILKKVFRISALLF
jgi:hypothetical protein